jgi:hypothetical protein
MLSQRPCGQTHEAFPMTEAQRDELIRQYAAGGLGWSDIQDAGFRDWLEVLGALGERGLRLPSARMVGPNAQARQDARARLRQAIEDVRRP